MITRQALRKWPWIVFVGGVVLVAIFFRTILGVYNLALAHWEEKIVKLVKAKYVDAP